MKLLVSVFLIALLSQFPGISQCNVKTINRPDGTTVKYLNPELVGTGTNCELGLSVSFNGEGYLINTTVRYSSLSKKQIGTLKVQLQNNDAIVLDLFNSELATMQGNNVSLGVYLATDNDILKLKASPLVRVVFAEANGVNQIVTISKSNDLLMRQIKCLERITSQNNSTEKTSTGSTTLSNEQLKQYYDRGSKDPNLIFLRQVFDKYSAGVELSSDIIEDMALEGIKSFNKEYFQSKFFLATIVDAKYGGKWLQFAFINKPDRVFLSWILNNRLKGFGDANWKGEVIKMVQNDAQAMNPVYGF